VTEFSALGRTLFDLRFGQGSDSYRAFRFPWVGRPLDRPAVVVEGRTAYVSWNGATEVAAWRVAAPDIRVHKRGFETAIRLPKHIKRLEIEALDASGRVLGASQPVSVR
jgi:hypothetical protein